MIAGQDIYLDHAAATPLATAVEKAMQPFWIENFANPASTHAAGKFAQQAVEQARRKIATILRAETEEIIFVSGGTESTNLAIKGVAGTFKKPSHMIVAQIEHHAVIDPLHELERIGWEVSYVAVDKNGLVRLSDVAGLIRPETALISIGYVNNEIGVIQPIEQLTRLAHKHQVLFHTDACQAGLLPLSVKKLGVDLMTLNAAKMHGPKGVGILYKKKSIRLQAQQLGGGQERGLRSGTENVPAIVGMAVALEETQKNKKTKLSLLKKLEEQLHKGLRSQTEVTINGSESKRLPGLINIQIKDIKAESFIQKLSAEGIYISRGAACQASSLDDSHVLTALQITPAARKQSIRFSLSTDTTTKDITQVLTKIKKNIIMMLVIKGLHVEVEGKEILKGVDLEIKDGTIHALMGPNGSGKSTLAQTLAGHPLYKVTKGSILFQGKDIIKLSPDKRARAGMFLAFQYPSSVPGVTMLDLLRSAINARKPEGEKIHMLKDPAGINEKLELLGLDKSFLARPVNEGLSGGEKKRAEVLQLAVLEPLLAIMDETDSGLDIDALKIVAEGVMKVKKGQQAILLITHYQRILQYIKPDQVHVMVAGKIITSGSSQLAERLEQEGYEQIIKEFA